MHLGIDLGTTNSTIAGNVNSKIRVFKTSDGADVLPSAIYIDKRGHRLFGKRAYDQTLMSPENVAAGFKRLMGTSTKIEFAGSGHVLTPEECSAEILRQLIGQAFTESGESEITGTVISIPAAFNQMQSEATIRAAGMAKIERVALLQEPIAASMAAMAESRNKSGQFLVYDLGGGTFDLALVQSLSGSVNIIAHEGINMLGGRDFDRIVVNSVIRPWLAENFDLPEGFQGQEKYRRVFRIAHLAAEKAKIALSTQETETIFASEEEVRVTDESGSEIYIEIEITRSQLDSLVSEYCHKTIELSRKILKENGYTHEDIDSIVFIGGPTKMPTIRNLVPQELGIPADLKTDAMTAVAYGAAIYSESRDWSRTTTTRKASRGSVKSAGKLDIKYDFPARTSDDRAKILINVDRQVALGGYEVQIDTATGWTSGRKTLSKKLSIEVPVHDIGENPFRITIFDTGGAPVPDVQTILVITRTHASAAGIPATQTISVKVREGPESARNTLEPLIEKGTLLPASGPKPFRAARDLEAGENSHLDFELYQDEGLPEPELNLCIGVFRVSGTDLADGMMIRAGDEVIFHWTMSDSALLTATVELPSVGQSFDTPTRFYVDQAGHQSFDFLHGTQLAGAVLNEAHGELQEVEQTLGASASEQVQKIEKRIQEQKETLGTVQDCDTIRIVTEEARHIRQDIARLRLAPENRALVLEREIAQLKSEYNRFCRENADPKVSNRFDQHASNAQRALARGDEKALKEVEAHVKEMDRILTIVLWEDPGYIVWLFKNKSEERYRADDKAKFDELVNRGQQFLAENNIDELRRILFQIYDNEITVGTIDKRLGRLSSIMRA